jgi:sugar porter (SP) family MFS transporter
MESGSIDASYAVALDSRRRNLLVWRLAAVAGFTGVLFGYDISAINDAVVFMQRRFALSSLDRGVVVSALLLGALVGALGAGKLADTWGRRRSVVVAGLAAAAGALMAGLAVNVPMLLAGRLILGVAVGVTSAISPLYIAELAPARSRGSMVALYQLSLTVGILAALAVGVAFTPTANWRIMIAAGAVPAIAQVLAMAIVPESPRYLVARGRLDAARRVLARLRPAGVVDRELHDIEQLHRTTAGARYRDVFGRSARPALIIGVGAALMNALVGVGAVIYYSTDIFQTAGVCSGRSPRTKTAAAPPSPSARRGRQPTAARASLATRRWTRRSWWLQARSQRAAFWPSDAGAASMTPSICRNGRPFRHMRSMLDSRSARPNMSTCLPPRAPANRVRASDPAVSGKKCG